MPALRPGAPVGSEPVDLSDSPEDAAFRARAREWLAGNVGPYRIPPGGPSLVFADVSDPGFVSRGRAWQRELFDAGWAGLGWSKEYGGQGLPPSRQLVWAEEAAAAGAPPGVNLIGEGVAGPAILASGTEEQKRRWLVPLLRGDEIWCQLFSEPDAGSDLAAVQTVAEREGDGWTVSGHKSWASAASYAELGLLLARSQPGFTCLVVDLREPGVSVRPRRQLTGGSAFADVVLDRVRVPDSSRLGPEGGGWAVALAALAGERMNLGLGLARTAGLVDRILDDLRTRPAAADPLVRQLAAQLCIESRTLRHLGQRAVSGTGPAGEVLKLAASRLARRTDEMLDAMRGAGALLHDEWTLAQLWSPAVSIGGGTDEVVKDVVAQRVLGLPRRDRA